MILNDLQFLSNSKVSIALTLLSVTLFFYEGFFVRFSPLITNSIIPLILLLIAFLFLDKEKIVVSKSILWYLLFLVTTLVSGVFALKQIEPELLIKGCILFAQFLLVILIGSALGEKILKYIVYISTPLSLTAVYQFIARVETPRTWLAPGEEILTRSFAFFGSPNVLGILASVLVFVSFGLFLKYKKKQYLAFVALNTLVVLVTYSRTAWLSLLMGFAFLVVVLKPKLFLFSPAVLLVFFVPQIRNRLLLATSQSYLYDSWLDGRVWSLLNGIHIFKKYPLFGTGPGTYGGQLALNHASPIYLESMQGGYTALYFTDNQYIELLVQTGLVGILLFLGFLVSLFSELIFKFKKNKDIIGLTAGASLVVFMVSGLFANVLEFGAVAIPVGLIVGAGISE
jgi:O-antigen ligase